MTLEEIADAVFSPATRDAPMPVGREHHLWPAISDTACAPVTEWQRRNKELIDAVA